MHECSGNDCIEDIVDLVKIHNKIAIVVVEVAYIQVLDEETCEADSINTQNYVTLHIREGSELHHYLTNIYAKVDELNGSKNPSLLKSPCAIFLGAMGLPLAVIPASPDFQGRLKSTVRWFAGIGAMQAVEMIYDRSNEEDKYSLMKQKALKMACQVLYSKGDTNHVRTNMELGWEPTSEEEASVDTGKEEEKTEKDHQQAYSAESSVKEPASNENILHWRTVGPQETKILFRHHGKMFSKTFPVSTKVKELRQYVTEQLGLKSFNLSFLAPIKKEEEDLTLKELHMVPSAVLFVMPIGGGQNSLLEEGFSRLATFFWFFAMPLITCLQYLNNFLFGGVRRAENRGTESSSSSDPHPPPPPSGGFGPQQPQSNSGSNKKYGSSNIHTLRSLRDDNSQNNTYNGNSTQQMP